jgi:hypothetical protein
MQRRNALKLLVGAAGLPLLSSEALAFFQSVQAQVPQTAALKAFSADQNAIVETISELIIPATDTPGAKAARVSEFIDLILSDWSKEDEKTRFLAGVDEVNHRSQVLYGKRFVDAAAEQQKEILHGFDDELMAAQQVLLANRRGNRKPPEKTFFYMMKQLTLVGYYTSQVGAQEELHYEIIPHAHEQCAPVPTTEKS